MSLKRMDPPNEPGAPAGESREDEPAVDPLQILYVEDNDTNWLVTKMTLSKRYGLARASNSSEALGLLRERTFDLILMDIELQGSKFDGIELTQILKSFESDEAAGVRVPIEAPIIFMTAYSGRYMRSELIAFGGDELVSKPVDFDKLQVLLGSLVRSKTRAANSERVMRRHALGELERANKDKERVEEKLIHSDKLAVYGTLTASIVHELCSPLNCIIGVVDPLEEIRQKVELAAGDATDEPVRKLLDDFEQIVKLLRVSSQKMMAQTDVLRRGSRISVGTMEHVQIDQVLAEALMVASGRTKLLSLRVDASEKNGVVRCRPGQIGQVLLNLIVNAADALEEYLPSGERKMLIRHASHVEREQSFVKIEVHDNGSGVPKDIRDRIFEGFFTTKGEEKGTGLGLSICRDIVSEHDGRLWVEQSGELGGACFVVILPTEGADASVSE